MLTPVCIAILLFQLPLHLGQLPLQRLDLGLVGLGIEPLLQLFFLLFQLFDLTVYLVAIALPDLVFVLFPSGCFGASAARDRSSK